MLPAAEQSLPVSSPTENTKVVIALLLFVLALGLRVLYVNTAVIDHPIRADAAKYITLADNLLNHGVYSSGRGQQLSPETTITPGYPLFLAALLDVKQDNPRFSYWLILNLQAVLGAFIVLFTFRVGLLFLPLRAACGAGLLAALSPHLIVSCGYVLTETLFTFLLMISLYLLLRARIHNNRVLYLVFGLLCALATLVRPSLALYPFCIVIGLFVAMKLKNYRLQTAGFILLGFLVVVAPWLLWQQHATTAARARYSPVASSFALGTYPNLIYRNPKLRGFPYREDPAYTEMGKSLVNGVAVLKQRAAAEPARYLYWYLIGKPLTYWSWSMIVGQGGPFIYPVVSTIYQQYTVAAATLWLFNTLRPLLLLLAAWSCAYVLFRIFRAKSIHEEILVISLLAATLLYFTLVHTVLAPLPRYAIPVIPVLYLTAAFGLWKAAALIGTLLERNNSP